MCNWWWRWDYMNRVREKRMSDDGCACALERQDRCGRCGSSFFVTVYIYCALKKSKRSPCYSPTRLASITALTYNWGGKLFKKKFFSLYTNGLHCKTCGMDSDPSDHVVVVNSSGFLNIYFSEKSLKQYRKFSWLSHAPKKVNLERKQSYFEWKQVLI